jgi:UDP-glucose 4-epimerase
LHASISTRSLPNSSRIWAAVHRVTRQKILITGGRGFIGTNLMRRIRDRSPETELVVLDNGSMAVPGRVADGSVIDHDGDVRDPDVVKHAVAGCTAIVHLAGHTRVVDSIQNPELDFEVNARGTLNVLMAARDAGVPHVVLASTGGALFGSETAPTHEGLVPEPLSPYGASKLAMEGYAHAFAASYGIRTTALRFSNVYGPHSHLKGSAVAVFFRQILARQPITVYGDGSQARDFVFVEDLCDGVLQVLETSASGIFHLGSGQPTSIANLLENMRHVVGPNWSFEVRYVSWRTGEVVRTYSDIGKAARTFGYQPKVTLDVGLPQTWRWFLHQHAVAGRDPPKA